MLNNLVLFASLLIGYSLAVHAHDLRGSATKPNNEFSKVVMQLEEQGTCFYVEVCCDGVCQTSPSPYTSNREASQAKICKNECLANGGGACNWTWFSEACNGESGGGSNRRPGNRGAGACRGVRSNEVCPSADYPEAFDCDNGTELCCSQSTTAEVDFGGAFGHCVKKNPFILSED